MASFDKSFYDLLKRYQSINERYQVIDTATGEPVGAVDELPSNIRKLGAMPTPQQNADYFKSQADAIRSTDPARAAMLDKTAARSTTPINYGPEASTEPNASTETPAAAPAANNAPTEEEKTLFKKLHGSNYDPNSKVDKEKFAQLKSAGEQTGGYKDVENVRNIAYANQYKGSDLGNYYTGNIKAVDTGKPGQPAGQSTVNAPTTPTTNTTTTQQQSTPASPANAPAVTSAAPSAATKPPVTSAPPSKTRSQAAAAPRRRASSPQTT